LSQNVGMELPLNAR